MAVKARDVHIHQDNICICFGNKVENIPAAACSVYLAATAEMFSDDMTDAVMMAAVFNDQDCEHFKKIILIA